MSGISPASACGKKFCLHFLSRNQLYLDRAPLFLPSSHLFHLNTVQTELRFLHWEQQIHIKSGFFCLRYVFILAEHDEEWDDMVEQDLGVLSDHCFLLGVL